MKRTLPKLISNQQSTVNNQQSVSIPRAIKTAIEHQREGRLQQAEIIYGQILKVEPENADANHLLGVIAHHVGKNEIALQLISKAIRKNAYQPSYFNDLGLVFRKLGEPEDAVESYERALGIKPDYAEAYNNLGDILKDQGKPEDAAASYERALSIKPDYAEAHNNLGDILKDQGKPVDAAASYERALSLKPDYAEAHYNLGDILKDQGKPEDAAASYERALGIKPDYMEAHYNLGAILKDQGKPEDAAASYERVLSLKPDYAEAHYNLGDILEEQGKPEDAAASYERALIFKPDYAEARNKLENVLKEQEDILKEQEKLKDAKKKWSKIVLAIVVVIMFGIRGLPKIINRFRTSPPPAEVVYTGKMPPSLPGKPSIVLDDSGSSAHRLSASVYLAKNQIEQAITEIEKAIVFDPNDAEAHFIMGEILIDGGRPEEAIHVLEKAMRLNPHHRAGYITALGAALRLTGWYEEAVATVKKALSRDPDWIMTYVELAYSYGWLWITQQDPDPQVLDQSLAMAQKVLALDDSLPMGHALLSTAYLWKKQHAQAIAGANNLIRLAPGDAAGYLSLANVLNFAGRPEEAIEMVEKATRLDTRNPVDCLYQSGRAFRLTDRYEEAVAKQKRVLSHNPRIGIAFLAHLELAILYSDLGRKKDARTEVAQILRLSPDLSREVWGQRVPYKDQALVAREINALRKAGLK